MDLTVSRSKLTHSFARAGPGHWPVVPSSSDRLARRRDAYELDSSGVYAAHGVTVLSLEAERIDEIIHFRTPSLVESFGLPPRA